MDCELLINLVRSNQHLYDKGKKGSCDKELIINTWNTISQALDGNYTAIECERKWKLLRERYTREHRMYMTLKENYEENLKTSPDLEPPQEPYWEYYSQLKFLDQHIKHKNRSYASNAYLSKSEEMDARFLEYVDTPLCDTPSPTAPSSPQFASNKKRRKPYCDPLESVKCEMTFSPPSPVPSTSSSCSSRKKKLKEEDCEMKNDTRRYEDGDELFGRLVAAELKKIEDDNIKRIKKRDILNILYT